MVAYTSSLIQFGITLTSVLFTMFVGTCFSHKRVFAFNFLKNTLRTYGFSLSLEPSTKVWQLSILLSFFAFPLQFHNFMIQNNSES